MRKQLKEQIINDIDKKNAPFLAELDILRSKLSILQKEITEDERKLRTITSREKYIHKETIKIDGLNTILTSYIDIINEHDTDKLS